MCDKRVWGEDMVVMFSLVVSLYIGGQSGFGLGLGVCGERAEKSTFAHLWDWF